MNKDLTLTKSYQAAEKIMKEHSKSFFQAFASIPKKRFQGVVAVYSFCRYVDDLVDEASESNEIVLNQLNVLETTILSLGEKQLQNSITKLDWWPAFEETVVNFGIQKKALLEQIEGQKSDLCFSPFETMESLETYCRNVAGSVGAMLWPMIGDEKFLTETNQTVYLEYCYQLGMAMQITNILRDIGDDARKRGRVYLPTKLLSDFGWTISDVMELSNNAKSWKDIPENFSSIWEEVSKISQKYYNVLDNHINIFHPSCRLGLLSAANIYHAIEDEIRNDHYDCITKRQYTSRFKRLSIINDMKKRLQKISKS